MRTVVIARCHGALRCYVVKGSISEAMPRVRQWIEEQYGMDARIISATEVDYGPEHI